MVVGVEVVLRYNMKKFSVGVIHYGEIPQSNLQQINIGMMIRTSVLFGCTEFFVIGDCGFDKKFLYGHALINAVNNKTISINNIACKTKDNIISSLNKLSQLKVFSTPNHSNIKPFDYEASGPEPLFLFGSETTGIHDDIITGTFNSAVVTIPNIGNLTSYNSSTSMAIVCSKYLNI